MYLKISYDKKVKKTLFKEEFREFGIFLDFLSTLTLIPKEEIKMTFKDSDSDDINIQDNADLNYFFKDCQGQQFACLKVERKIVYDFRETTMEETPPGNNTEIFFNNVTNDISINFPNDPFHVDQSNINLLNFERNEEAKTEDRNLMEDHRILDLHFEKTNKPETNQEPENEKKEFPKIPENDPKVENEVRLKSPSVNFEKQAKLISQPISILKKAKEIIVEQQPGVLTEQSSFGMSILDRLCALEQKLDFVNASLAQPLLDEPEVVILGPPKPRTPSENRTEIQTRHSGICCTVCRTQPIVGKRYKCLVCSDFDLCEECDLKNPHVHPMVRCIARQDEDALFQLRKKFVKLAQKGEKGKLHEVLKSLNPFKKRDVQVGLAVTPVKPVFEMDQERRTMLEFMDPTHRLNVECVLMKYREFPLEVFCERVFKELS